MARHSLDVLYPGDFISNDGELQGEHIRLVSSSISAAQPAHEFQVVRRLGTGSYAVVYLVKEVLYRPPVDDDANVIGPLDLDAPQPIEYGGEYAIKCLSKENLDPDALAAQMAEVPLSLSSSFSSAHPSPQVTIHQSLLSHPNIVTLHRTLETDSYLLLVLEYVPGEDLFYFLAQARDHYDPVPDNTPNDDTPPTPSLLSALNSAQLLSRSRLRLIASMFAQMCEAVAACHVQQVFHRDIKPENFIVTDGWSVAPDGSPDRKVIVKLSDFGLSTTDLESSDMDCGSAPYMSYGTYRSLTHQPVSHTTYLQNAATTPPRPTVHAALMSGPSASSLSTCSCSLSLSLCIIRAHDRLYRSGCIIITPGQTPPDVPPLISTASSPSSSSWSVFQE